jgi:hypothetical protein
MKKIKIFINNDLDGAGSLMVIRWIFGDSCDLDYTVSNVFNIKRDYDDFINSGEYNSCDKIFILNIIPLFDVLNNTLVFSKSGKHTLKYKGKIAPANSTTSLLIDFFKSKVGDFTDKQNAFVKMVDDFYVDGGSKSESIKLKAVFSYGRNKLAHFHDRFINGFDGFTDEELPIIRSYIKRLSNVYKNIEVYKHESASKVYICTVPDMTFKHELLDLLFKKYDPNIIFLVDYADGLISARKSKSCDINMNDFCGNIIEGRSLCQCAGGKYTEKFLEFVRKFEKV